MRCGTKRADIDRVVEPQSVNAVVAKQQERVVDDVLPNLRPAVIRAGAKSGAGAIAAIKIDPPGICGSGKAAKPRDRLLPIRWL